MYNKSGGRHAAYVRLLNHVDISRVVAFLVNFAEDHSLMLPGQIPGFERFDIKLLPCNYTKASVWRIYTAAMEAAGERAINLDSFCKLWRTLVPYITHIDTKRIFELIHTPRPGRHNKSKVRHYSRLDERHKFFSQQVIKPWNTLPSDCVNAPTVNNFKTKYQNYCHNHRLGGYI